MTFEPDGRRHQLNADLGELSDPRGNTPYQSPRAAPISLYFAGLVVPGRPNLASGYTLLEVASGLTIISTILHPSGWAAAGAARLTLGSADVLAGIVDGKDLVGITEGFRADSVLRIGPDNPLIAKVDGSPSAGVLAVYIVAAATSSVIAGQWTDDTQTYRLS